MPKCFLIHGYGSTYPHHGEDTVDRLSSPVASRGWTPKNFDWKAHWAQCTPHSKAMNRIGLRLKKRVSAGDAAIGHSTGAAVIYKALVHGAKLQFVILVHPNLDSDVKFPAKYLKRVWVISSSHDEVVPHNHFPPFNVMGSMGKDGYQGDDDSRVTDFVRMTKAERMHANLFEDDKVDEWGKRIAGLLPKVQYRQK